MRNLFRRGIAIACPVCGAKSNAHEPIGNTEAVAPQDGDVSMCVYCTAFLRFENNLSGLRLLTADEIADLDAHMRALLVRARRFFKAAQVWRGHAADCKVCGDPNDGFCPEGRRLMRNVRS